MRVVLDTNVFVSGVYFHGTPSRILRAWRDGRVKLVVSAEILEEYRRVGEHLGQQYPGVDLNPFLELLAVEAEVVIAPRLDGALCEDPDDDIFIFCAVAGKSRFIVSGDKLLRKLTGFRGIEILSPRAFVDNHL